MAWDMQEEGGGTGPLHFLLLPSPETHSHNFSDPSALMLKNS